MAITNLQQARQMYAMGQRVAKTFDGSRPGYGGGADMGTVADSSGSVGPGLGGYQGGGDGKGGKAGGPGDGPDDRSSDLQTYNTKKATGKLGRQDANQMTSTVFYGKPTFNNPYGMIDIGYQGPLNTREQALKAFLDYRPEVKTPPLGILAFLKGPLQSFSNFTTAKNRKYFQDVIRAGKIPGLSFDMTQQQFEKAYQDYMSDRLSGKIDAMGNPNPAYNRDEPNQGIESVYNYNMFDENNTVGDNASTDLFVSRFLQNQPENVRSDIESRMQNYYTV